MNTEIQSLSKRLKERIAQSGMSIHAFEKKAGLKPSAVQNIIYGKSKSPTFNIIKAIAETLNCPVSELMGETNREKTAAPTQDLSPTETYIAAYWRPDFYIEVLTTINTFLKKSNRSLPKDKMLKYADEVYVYSLKSNKAFPDPHFTAWLIEPALK